ncbi:MAG: nucleotidyl transferase AbiEii/AbiGii toxin family protein [Nitrosopumilus sp. (ex Thoosa mismalolli)]|nr:nucleotidyl transferase AbiEii/AbiGii toxin family protein [Nitrosopumilus sp. (ex Thoosa mismalolli)]
MRKELIDEIARKFKIGQTALIEKDVILHEILTKFSQDKYFSENYLFKGGTCLVKAFLGYVRFSEDLDFTWKNQDVYEGKSGNAVERKLSNEIEILGKLVEQIAAKLSLDFKFDKTDYRYFQFGGGGKMLTLCVWYNSEINNAENMIKIQINFVEQICYTPESNQLQSLAPDDEELKLLFPDNLYFEIIEFSTYSPKEILCEKIRAILTRRGVKARDFLDIYHVCKKYGTSLSEITENSILKLKFSLDMYKKYRENMNVKLNLMESGEMFAWGNEKSLLLQELDEEDFKSFEMELEKYLKESVLKLTGVSFFSEITALCSNCLQKTYIPNPQGKRFDEIDLSSDKCPNCNSISTLQAFPM